MPATPPLVSIVIPTYNRAHLLERALGSVVAQTYPHFEAIVVDDGSTDGTRELVAQRYGGDPRIRYTYQINRGVSTARNVGLAQTRGELIALLDSDDWWKPWKLELQVACLQRYPQIGMVWTDMEAVDRQGQVFNPRYLRTMYRAYRWFDASDLFRESQPLPPIGAPLPPEPAAIGIGDIYSQMIMGNLVHTSTVLFRRERLDKVRGFNETLRPSGGDYDFHLRVCREGPVGFINLAAIGYQVGMADQLTSPTYAIHSARNFLRTIEPAITRDRDRITLPNHMIRTALASAHGWIGEAALNIGAVAEARRHLLRSLIQRPWQPRVAALLLIAALPKKLGERVRDRIQQVKRILVARRGARHGPSEMFHDPK